MSDSHEPSHYVKIWAILLVLLVISIVGPLFGVKLVMLLTAFGIAVDKAGMVVRHFMHIGVEKKYIAYLMVICLAFMALLFAGIAPDIMKGSGQNWENTAVVARPPPVGEHATHSEHKTPDDKDIPETTHTSSHE